VDGGKTVAFPLPIHDPPPTTHSRRKRACTAVAVFAT
jgi:hypothetical protein